MVLIEKPPVSKQQVTQSLRDIQNTEDAQWVRVSRFSPPVRPTKFPIRNMAVMEDAQWRKLTSLETALRPISKFMGW